MIFEGHLTEDERFFLYQETVLNAEVEKGFAFLNQIEASHKVNELTAEAKVLEERGTYDDLAYLYEEANKDEEKSKEGIITRILNAIKTFLDNILSKFRSKKANELLEEAKKHQNEKVNAAGVVKASNHLFKAWDAVKGFFTKMDPETGEKELNLARTALTGTVGTVSVISLVALFPKLTEFCGSVRNIISNKLSGNKNASSADSAGKKAMKKIDASGNTEKQKKSLDVIHGIGTFASKAINFITNKFKSVCGGKKDDQSEQTQSESNDTESNDTDGKEQNVENNTGEKKDEKTTTESVEIEELVEIRESGLELIDGCLQEVDNNSSIFTEGANLESRKIFKEMKKQVKILAKQYRLAMKRKDFTSAKSAVTEMKSLLKKSEGVIKGLSSDLGSAIFGWFAVDLLSITRALWTLIPLAGPFITIYINLKYWIDMLITMINDIKKSDSLSPKNFNLYRAHLLSTIKTMQKTVEQFDKDLGVLQSNSKKLSTSSTVTESAEDDDFDSFLESLIEEDESGSATYDTDIEDFFGESSSENEIDNETMDIMNELFG